MLEVIKEPSKLTEKLMRTFTDISVTEFRPSPYIVFLTNEKGLLVFTTLTCTLLQIYGVDSLNQLCERAGEDSALRKTLLFYRVLIPKNFDEQNFCDQLRRILLNEKKRQSRGKINSYIIFTTTACNARCYYCFEHGYVPVTMSEKTALRTAEYIETHSDGPVTITWFGGEPLVNTEAIDIITDYLTEHNIIYKSRIVTNSYLFTPELIEKARDKWHLINAQITLDGTKDNYNRIKNYKNGDDDAFSHVIGNIQALANKEIHILLNFTLSRENEKDLYELLSELAPMIRENPGQYSVCPNLLQQYGGTDEEEEMQQKLIRMKQWLMQKELIRPSGLPQRILINSCTADNPGMTVIQADGYLNCCDHIGVSEPYGSIFDEKTEKSVINWWAERKAQIPECRDCPIYPQCLRLAHCEAKKFSCTEIIRRQKISAIKIAAENEYRLYNKE